MRAAVCDDNKMCLQELKEQLLLMPLVKEVFPFSDLNLFLSSVQSGNVYDVVFMDIDWGYRSMGIDAAGELYVHSPKTKVVYVTGHGDKYSQNIFLHNANLSGFLTKPVNSTLLRANLQKVADTAPAVSEPSVFLRQGSGVVSVPCLSIYYIESRGRTVEMHTSTGAEIFYGKLESILNSLPGWFVQCHKSYIVNMRQIQRFQSTDILLKNGDIVPASRSKYNSAKEAYFGFIGKII